MKRAPHAAMLLLLSTAACVGYDPHGESAAPQPVFSPLSFFNGKTSGDGVLRVALSHARRVHVAGAGQVDAEGSLTLVQQVEEEGSPSRSRTWHLRPLGDGRFAGTLTDAKGPVLAAAQGNLLHIRFRTTGGLDVEQWLFLQPDRATALNRMVVSKFGIRVAVLRETIRRVP